ncbi:MAG: hypothetical protein DRR08_15330 [Candidatus Parabeggiatoa sp. nov. 2]|nr:MAG: hypothetical protein B6247_19145 [Beggiatoa sp. 4572_84]RKZ58877.1 MAG: hypothetical protein DRR08_15330 [Gammaproteobacteria bacterium]HEC85641.1 hypothetical protein [Thioploca sp.]
MQKYSFNELTLADLKTLVDLNKKGIADYPWTQVKNVPLIENEKLQLRHIMTPTYPAHVMNEATLWARTIYPLLRLAEREDILATAEVSLTAQYPTFELHGIVDGILGKCIAGHLETPYLVIVEAKRGIEGKNPQPQLYGELLATAHLNWQDNGNDTQEIYGCYTIADAWTFVRAEITDIESERPKATLEHSKEYTESTEAETILKILKSIVSTYIETKP